MNFPGVVLTLNAASTFALFGLIWTVQLVHYPAFRYVSNMEFAAFERFHQRRISLVVMPLMLVELGTAIALLGWRPAEIPIWVAATGAALVLSIWGCTFAVQVPLHQQLAQRHDPALIEALIKSNWIRTLLWTLRAGLMLGAIAFDWPGTS